MSTAIVAPTLLSLFTPQPLAREGVAVPVTHSSPVITDRIDLSEDGKRALAAAKERHLSTQEASVKTRWPGPAAEGSPFHGQKSADGLWLDAAGHAVVLDPEGRTVLIGTANGRQIQQWGDILNDSTGRYSDVDKAKAYNQLLTAWQDGNPNFTMDEKRAAGGIANNSDFISKVMALNDKVGSLITPGQSSIVKLINWHDNEATDWEQELLAGQREAWEAVKLVLDGIDARVRAGAFTYGDQNPSDGETRWLLAMFSRIGEVSNRPWEHPDLRAALGAIRDALRAGYQG
jgi:hypothetical protein